MLKVNTTSLSPTSLSYYQDAYARTKRSWVDAVGVDDKNRLIVLLSDSIFYPAGGGQKGDRGTIIIPETIMTEARSGGDEVPPALTITDTRKEDGFVINFVMKTVKPEILEKYVVGKETVLTELDWNFRFTQMRLHSSAHLIHLHMEKVLGREIPHPNLSDIQETRGVNRYDIPNLLTEDQLNQATLAVNEFTASGHEIRTYPDTSSGKPLWARLWQCEQWKIPCGGVHPANSKEIGPIQTSLSMKKCQTTVTFSLA